MELTHAIEQIYTKNKEKKAQAGNESSKLPPKFSHARKKPPYLKSRSTAVVFLFGLIHVLYLKQLLLFTTPVCAAGCILLS